MPDFSHTKALDAVPVSGVQDSRDATGVTPVTPAMPAHDILVPFNPADEAAACPHLGPAVLSIGVFDGVHLGHRALLAATCERAAKRGARPVVVTFERDPDELFCRDGASFGKLLSNAERLDTLAALVADALDTPDASPASGTSDASGTPDAPDVPDVPAASTPRVLVLPVSPDALAVPPAAFLDALARVCEPLELHVGEGFRFGAKAAGTLADVRTWGASRGLCATEHALVEYDGAPVTSTCVRALLREGDVQQAAQLCAGRFHAVSGTVAHGRGAGTGMGFATANLDLAANETMLPAEGVYAAWAEVDGARYPSAVNLGTAASFSDATSPLEAHLLGFTGDIYGKKVRVEFVRRLRAQRVFTDTDELVETVKGDIASVRAMLGEGGHAPYQR